jgi:4-hydroxy-tetrahydrodipicolinate synthase
MKFEGIYTPSVTPHHANFDINEEKFEATINELIDAGVNGIIVAGTTCEYYAQSAEERVALMHLAKQLIDDKSIECRWSIAGAADCV